MNKKHSKSKSQEAPKDKAFGLASFICGLLFWLPLFNILLGPIALVFGIIQVRRIKQDPSRYGGQGYAIAGIILGLFCIVSTIFYYYNVYVNPQSFQQLGLNLTALNN